MQPQTVMEHFRGLAHWVDWNDTLDHFLHGDPHAPLRGIAVAWIPTDQVLSQARERGLNFVVSHEEVFYDQLLKTSLGAARAAERRRWLDDAGMVVMRCHDTWDKMPVIGVVDSWVKALGFAAEQRPVDSYYCVCHADGETVASIGRRLLRLVRSMGQRVVNQFGDGSRPVSRIVVGTGAITNIAEMAAMEPDVLIVTDDGFNSCNGGLLAYDLDIPMLVVNHYMAERPGIEELARYLRRQFPQVPVEFFDAAYTYQKISEGDE